MNVLKSSCCEAEFSHKEVKKHNKIFIRRVCSKCGHICFVKPVEEEIHYSAPLENVPIDWVAALKAEMEKRDMLQHSEKCTFGDMIYPKDNK